MLVKHKFLDAYPIKGKKILIIGTFNPDTISNSAQFYYGRKRNYFWELLPKALGKDESLKGCELVEKQKAFLEQHSIELSDLIYSVELNEDEIGNYSDDKLNNVISWNTQNIIEVLNVGNVKEVYFTRISFNKKVQRIQENIQRIENTCKNKDIKFSYLPTPSRPPAYNNNLEKWINAFQKQ